MQDTNPNSSVGEYKVRTNFNVSDSGTIKAIKDKTAELINLVNRLNIHENFADRDIKEFYRLKALAMTEYELAAMWAVKAATV